MEEGRLIDTYIDRLRERERERGGVCIEEGVTCWQGMLYYLMELMGSRKH